MILYQRDDGAPALDVRLHAETVWLSQQQIAELFQTTRENITMHLQIDTHPPAVPGWELTLDEARDVIEQIRESPRRRVVRPGARGRLAGIIATLCQSFGGEKLYPTVEEKAANLLHLVVKDHPLSDGNERTEDSEGWSGDSGVAALRRFS